MFMVALLSWKVRHPKSKKKRGPDFLKSFYIVHHYLECVISWRAPDRDAAFSFCGVSSVEMVSCITTLILKLVSHWDASNLRLFRD